MKDKKILLAGCLLVIIILAMPFLLGSMALGLTDSAIDDDSDANQSITGEPSIDGKPATKGEWKQLFAEAENVTKVPWEFIAAITWNETGFGNFLGNCSYFPTAPSGGHVLVDGNGLRKTNDRTNFENIANTLKIEKNRGVSCNPPDSNGGAMGYTQVMPTEWVNYAKQYIQLKGGYPNPWNAGDALIVSGLVLKGKAGIGLSDPFPENDNLIQKTAGKYYGTSAGRYDEKALARYHEIKASQELP